MSNKIRWYRTYDFNSRSRWMEEKSNGYGEFVTRYEAEEKINTLQRELDEYKQRDARQYDSYVRNKETP